MRKFRELADRLVLDGVVQSHDDFIRPKEPPDDWFLLAHDEEYYKGFVAGTLDQVRWRRIGFTQRPDHEALVRRTRLEVAGTVLTARLALSVGLACNTAGGTHHAHRSWGSGYTALNDLAVTTRLLLEAGVVSRVLICDLDVHQGDGTAEILADEPRAFTFSMHCATNFPFGFKGMAHLGHDRSDLDVGLQEGVEDDEYMKVLRASFHGALDEHRPDLVLYDAGVDIHAGDELGRLSITQDGLYRRDSFVIDQCLSRGIPVACVVGGGYAKHTPPLAQRHAALHHAAADLWTHHRL